MMTIKRVRIESGPNGTRISDAETGVDLSGQTMNIAISIEPMKLPVATVEMLTEFDGIAEPRFVPVFARAGRCQSCRHWTERKGDPEHGWCDLAGQTVEGPALMTPRDFGCILWEPEQ